MPEIIEASVGDASATYTRMQPGKVRLVVTNETPELRSPISRRKTEIVLQELCEEDIKRQILTLREIATDLLSQVPPCKTQQSLVTPQPALYAFQWQWEAGELVVESATQTTALDVAIDPSACDALAIRAVMDVIIDLRERELAVCYYNMFRDVQLQGVFRN